MNTKVIIAIVAVLIILGGAYFLMKDDEPRTESVSETRLADDSDMKGPSSLRELSLSGKPMQCDVNEADNQGSFFISDKNMRGDFSSTTDGKKVSGHMIVTDNTSYTWMDGEKTGFKISVSEEVKAEATENAQKNEQVDLDTKENYDCRSWNKDNSFFVVPADIEFTDLSAMMKTDAAASGSASGTLDMKAIQCAACDQAPAESRAECKAALACK